MLQNALYDIIMEIKYLWPAAVILPLKAIRNINNQSIIKKNPNNNNNNNNYRSTDHSIFTFQLTTLETLRSGACWINIAIMWGSLTF